MDTMTAIKSILYKATLSSILQLTVHNNVQYTCTFLPCIERSDRVKGYRHYLIKSFLEFFCCKVFFETLLELFTIKSINTRLHVATVTHELFSPHFISLNAVYLLLHTSRQCKNAIPYFHFQVYMNIKVIAESV